MSTSAAPNRRILVVDDNRTIHLDFRKILCPPSANDSLDEMEADLFGHSEVSAQLPGFEVDSAYQGEDALQLARSARQQSRPYALAFVDIRMPPGIDGVETTSRLWQEDPDLQVVICSAYADYSWEEMMLKLGLSQRLLILRKPFDGIEVRQLAFALTEKWELLRSNRLHLEGLSRAVEERTRQLTAANARLVQSQRLEALGRLSAGLAHEINNPLSFILANLSYLRTHLDVDPSRLSASEMQELREVCAESFEGAERIRRIIQNIKLFSRLDETPRTRVDVHEVLEQALGEARPLLAPTAQVMRDFQSLPPVFASENGLQQVFFGLLANAAQALKDGPTSPPTLRISTQLEEDGRIAVEIQDNGRGIAPEHLGRVFEPFFTTKRMGTTTGLGLSVCYGIILGLGGDITVDSTLGQGAIFRVLLPQAPLEHLTPAPVGVTAD
ncbi:ATP-binding protein [Hyalangium minutum]|uniref:histidine kinase n=1 Tax=Hyalangium minutum TaxID=394096 RepID=A0A085WCL8_9BACT|nr:ATP-binding protein [Hyalangium minutum]KFE65431.1 sensor histidine kinase/response regulator [Hyalangium minutum]